jgi:hypothetical protein
MKLLILYGGNFGERVVRNLVNDSEFCKSCDPLCTHCKYGKYSHARDMVGAIKLPEPGTLPDFIEDPDSYLPKLPSADVAIATEIHPDILLALPPRLNGARIRGLIVPISQRRYRLGWQTRYVRSAAHSGLNLYSQSHSVRWTRGAGLSEGLLPSSGSESRSLGSMLKAR